MSELRKRVERSSSSKVLEHIYSPSCLGCYQNCPRKAYYKYVLNLVLQKDSTPAFFGEVFHSALYQWYLTSELSKALEQFDQIPPDWDDIKRTPEHGRVWMKQYAERYPKESWEVVELEHEFEIEMPKGRKLIGRTDMTVKEQGNYYTVDHKAASSVGPSLFKGANPSLQFTSYAYSAQQRHGKCSGVILNAISTAGKPRERFARDLTPRTKVQLDRFPEHFTRWADRFEQDIEEELQGGEMPPMADAYCGVYGGCEYDDLCIHGVEDFIINSQFKEREDD